MKMIPKIKPKEKKEILPKRFNQKVYNRIFLGGLVGFVTLSSLAILSNVIKNVSSTQPVQVVESKNEPEDYRLQNYMNNFVYYYFTLSSDPEEQSVQAEKLAAYYVEGLASRNQGQVKQPSSVKSYRLLNVTESTVTYLVSYTVTQKVGDTEQNKDLVTEFVIPYKKHDNKYYVSDFPYFLPVENSQLTDYKDSEKFSFESDNMADNEAYQSLDEFIDLFFANYVSSQENLDLIAKGVKILPNTMFKTKDWSYVTENDGKYVVQTQVTFETAGVTRSEHFTLTISKSDDSFLVEKMEHGLVKQEEKKEE
ncbi:TPA: conjugal transfer protein [Streptococcus suis]|nr:conjugal transfer protein [Streptococcus suis]HEN0484744.1 conjugal transfer protein [Streptococcus suis]